MKRLLLPLIVMMTMALPAPSWADAPGHTIEDSRGEVGKRDPGAGMRYVTVPEIDLWWVDVVAREDAVEVSWRVENLSHRTFAPSWEGLNFVCAWSLLKADGSPGGTKVVAAERATGLTTGFWTWFEYDDGPNYYRIEGEFDWANNTVRARVPLSFFESGETLLNPLAWSSATTQNTIGFHTSTFEFGDRAPDDGWDTTDVHIP